MTPTDGAGAHYGPLIAIAAMAAATYLMRAGGFWLMTHVPLTPRVRRMLAALPGSVIAATVFPIVAIGGPVAMLAVGTAGVVMLATRNDFLAVIAGMGIAALLRAGGL
jgi:uncharacterized membrane protein